MNNDPKHPPSTGLPALSGVIAVLFAAILWGTTGTSASFTTGVSPLAIGAVAMGGGGLLQALLAMKSIIRQRRQLLRYPGYLLSGALSVALYPLAFYSSMAYAGIATGTVVAIGSAPLLTAVIEYLTEKQPLSRQWALGAGLGIAGITLLSLSEGHISTGTTAAHFYLGIALALVAGLTYALYSWSARQLMQQQIPSAAAMGATFGGGALLLAPVLWVTGAPLLATPLNMAVAAYMVLIPMFLGYFCYGFGLSRIRASTAITLTLAEPLVAALLAVLLVGEPMTLAAGGGIGLIILCLLVTSLPARVFRRRPTVSETATG